MLEAIAKIGILIVVEKLKLLIVILGLVKENANKILTNFGGKVQN